jgi:hypothetical protein
MRPGVMYAAAFALAASFGRFTGLFLADFGLSDSQVGMVMTSGSILSLVSVPARLCTLRAVFQLVIGI